VVELAVRVAAGGEDEHRPAQSGLAVSVVVDDVVEHEPGEHDEQLARAWVEPGGIQLL